MLKTVCTDASLGLYVYVCAHAHVYVFVCARVSVCMHKPDIITIHTDTHGYTPQQHTVKQAILCRILLLLQHTVNTPWLILTIHKHTLSLTHIHTDTHTHTHTHSRFAVPCSKLQLASSRVLRVFQDATTVTYYKCTVIPTINTLIHRLTTTIHTHTL